MVDTLNILEGFPFLIPSDDCKEWHGIIIVEDEEVLVRISVPNFPSLDNFSLKCPMHWERKLKQRLQKYQKEDKLTDLLQYLKCYENSTHCDFKQVEDDTGDNMRTLQFNRRVLEELRQMEDNAVLGCSDDLSRVTLRVIDKRGTHHQLIVDLPPDYPSSPAVTVDVDLPDIALSQLAQAKNMRDIMRSFENIIESLQDFWIIYEDLKNKTWIIDPENPRHKDTHCRIIIGENISMLVTLNPQEVNSCPDIKFLGPENLVTPFINSVENQLKSTGWDEDARVTENLLRLLGLPKFPQRSSEADVDTEHGECSICFTLRPHDNMPLPVKACNNTRCHSYFHISCLAQWFQAVPTNEASFNLISGGCPACGEKILCPVTVS